MIINIRGTSGSGKSTLVRAIMDLAIMPMTPEHKEGRKQPLLYRGVTHGPRQLAVLGHYNTACGGCDTINSLDEIAYLADREARHGYDVLFEGLLWSAETKRTIELARKHEVHVIALDLPLEECLAGVNTRRRAKDPTKEDVNPKNTISKHKGVKSCVRKLIENQVTTHVYDTRDGALAMARALLRI